MVSFSTAFIAATVLLATAVSALPANVHTSERRVDYGICGQQPAARIVSPVNGSTITFTAEEQAKYASHTFEVIYCSGQYYKTSSLYVDTWIADVGSYSSNGPGYFNGRAVGLQTPPDTTGEVALSNTYYGYRYNVSVSPINGNYELGPKLLTVMEVEKGYYVSNTLEAHSVYIEFTAEPKS